MLKDLLKAIARLFQVEVNAIQTEDIVISSDSDATKELGFEVIGTQSESNPGYFVVYSGTSPGVTSSCVPLVRIIIIVCFCLEKWTKAYNTQNSKTAFYVMDTTYTFWKYDSVEEEVKIAYVSCT